MYTVKWETWGNGNPRTTTEHGTFITKEEAFQSIRDWWNINEYMPPYVRWHVKGKVTVIDYGLHFAHYTITDETPPSYILATKLADYDGWDPKFFTRD